VEGRAVEAAFDAGLVTSDAGALLLGTTDRAIDLVDRFAGCFRDYRCQGLIEHTVATLVGQRVFAIALGYEDLNDHDELRHDPMMAVLAGKHDDICQKGYTDGREVHAGIACPVAFYNEMRTHHGLSKDARISRAVQRSGTIVTMPILSGLHHCYARI
jgi:hypothetical protein